jgi:hypothetical protein
MCDLLLSIHVYFRIVHPLISTYIMATLVLTGYAAVAGTTLTALLKAYFVSIEIARLFFTTNIFT